MQFGYNHNVQHKGKMYHIQTEDSGKPGMQLTTLLYCGGTIISSKKTGYAALAQKEDYKEKVQELMKNQHRQMLVDLKNGFYDDSEQSVTREPEELKKAEDKTILEAIEAIEKEKLKEIISQGEKKKEEPQEKAAHKPPQNSPEKSIAEFMSGVSIPPNVEHKKKEAVHEEVAATDKDEKRGLEELISEKSLDEVILNYLSKEMSKKGKEKRKS